MQVTKKRLWKVTARFPSHCGTPAYSDSFYYSADTIEEAIRNHQGTYDHSFVEGCQCLGVVNIAA